MVQIISLYEIQLSKCTLSGNVQVLVTKNKANIKYDLRNDTCSNQNQ